MPPTAEPYSFVKIVHFIERLFELVGFYPPKRIEYTDRLVNVLLEKPDNTRSGALRFMGFFPQRPTQASVLSKWEGNVTSLPIA